MARMARVVAVGHPHHVTQRGNLGGRVFETDGDRRFYLDLLADGMARFGLRVWAHCLMTNHIHLVCVPEAEHALSKVLARVHGRLAQRINRRRKQRGHLWQGRFYACPMDESHCWAAIRYVERNPVRAGLVAKAEDYPWSSARVHCGIETSAVLPVGTPPGLEVSDWSAWLAEAEQPTWMEALRKYTWSGLPFGTPGFVRALERQTGLFLGRRPVGRPRRKIV